MFLHKEPFGITSAPSYEVNVLLALKDLVEGMEACKPEHGLQVQPALPRGRHPPRWHPRGRSGVRPPTLGEVSPSTSSNSHQNMEFYANECHVLEGKHPVNVFHVDICHMNE